MKNTYNKIIKGYQLFRSKYALGDHAIMTQLSDLGQHPDVMIVACCDSRVDPSIILQCDPGDLFVMRNVANIVPPYIPGGSNYNNSGAALEFGIAHLEVKHLIILGHSQCGGIGALVNTKGLLQNEFITPWVSLIKNTDAHFKDLDYYAKLGLMHSYHNCLSYPFIKKQVDNHRLVIHQWFFNIKTGEILAYDHDEARFHKLDEILRKE